MQSWLDSLIGMIRTEHEEYDVTEMLSYLETTLDGLFPIRKDKDKGMGYVSNPSIVVPNKDDWIHQVSKTLKKK